MKYLVVLGDGMADFPCEELGGKTPLDIAYKPNIDKMAKNGKLGLVKTIPEHLPPGSDVANLSVMGYEPDIYYSGRSPLEAVSMGVSLNATDITFRLNLVTLSEQEPYCQKTMIDYSADEISSQEAAELIKSINDAFKTDSISFFNGISYRHLMVWHNGPCGFNLTPPHDILEKNISSYLPAGEQCEVIQNIMEKSYDILNNHPINIERRKNGLRPANSAWIWGEGKKPQLMPFNKKFGLNGSVISAVDLVKGIGVCAELGVVNVEGATGNIHTNFKGKAMAALEEFKEGKDFVYLHVEAPDECGHRHEVDNKVKSIEFIDKEIVGPVLEGLKEIGEPFAVMVLPDHPTPLCLRTHTRDAVPFLIYTGDKTGSGLAYNEENAKKTGIYYESGPLLMKSFLK